MGNISLINARVNPTLRQNYLDDLFESNPIPYCSGIVYDQDKTSSYNWILKELRDNKIYYALKPTNTDDSTGTAGIPLISYLFALGIDPKIFVYPRFFREEFTEKDHRLILNIHEGTHARQFAKGFPYFDNDEYREAWIRKEIRPTTCSSIAELEAEFECLKYIRNNGYNINQDRYKKIFNNFKQSVANLYNLRFSSRSVSEIDFIGKTLDFLIKNKIISLNSC